MNIEKSTVRYVAFLRGINVGGHHKVPMADLRKELTKLDLENVVTILNSGNVLFETNNGDLNALEKTISIKLEKTFGFPVPTILRKSKTIYQLFNYDPFKDIKITKDIRLYVSFLRKDTQPDVDLPWTSPDNSYKIIEKREKTIYSVLDLSIAKTPKVMGVLDKFYGTDITSRNWQTIERIVKKL